MDISPNVAGASCELDSPAAWWLLKEATTNFNGSTVSELYFPEDQAALSSFLGQISNRIAKQ
ncbi:uncharacterized protein ANIA_11457 [Aspergillus nidulans FGSC A4]|uniref:Uncharacterized protein n=1 Tax=Emericella nidulans (strain FGSC A4 / ATCC 38163 / CBS 112.46 / NRRL 194 / M139) TaxID=227321 RepID=C8V820_EMENI|nr:hypothetical protein [Aspergillus nidulans FGSC A4]CBF76175.1 TPA: hypothetical protein ANIA_11457 [Aspergillus nidulans FGSC A4]